MRLMRVGMYGGAIAGIAALAHYHTEGLLSATGLFVAVFALIVIVGLTLATLTQSYGPGSWSSVAATARRVRHRRSRDVCGVCARVIVNTGPLRVCASCDRIPALLVS